MRLRCAFLISLISPLFAPFFRARASQIIIFFELAACKTLAIKPRPPKRAPADVTSLSLKSPWHSEPLSVRRVIVKGRQTLRRLLPVSEPQPVWACLLTTYFRLAEEEPVASST